MRLPLLFIMSIFACTLAHASGTRPGTPNHQPRFALQAPHALGSTAGHEPILERPCPEVIQAALNETIAGQQHMPLGCWRCNPQLPQPPADWGLIDPTWAKDLCVRHIFTEIGHCCVNFVQEFRHAPLEIRVKASCAAAIALATPLAIVLWATRLGQRL